MALKRKGIFYGASLVTLILLQATTALASTSTTAQSIEDKAFPAITSGNATTQQVGGFSWGTFITVAFLFVILLGAGSYFVKRLNRTQAMTSPWFKVLDRQQMGPGHYVYLVELAGRLQILGVTNHGMFKIAELDDPELAGEVLQDLAWRAEQVLPPWWEKLVEGFKGHKFMDELKRYKGEDL